jgi:protein TonB
MGNGVAAAAVRREECRGMKTRLQAFLAAALLAGCAIPPGDILIVQDFDEPPRPISTPPPRYPYEAMDAGAEGSAEIDFVVTRRGRVMEVAFLGPLDPALKEAVLEGTHRWCFSPAVKDGKPVDSRLRTRVEFRRKTGTAPAN